MVGGGILLLLGWGMYYSLWSLMGLVLFAGALSSSGMILRERYAAGATLVMIILVIAYSLYPQPFHGGITLSFVLLFAGGVSGYALEMGW